MRHKRWVAQGIVPIRRSPDFIHQSRFKFIPKQFPVGRRSAGFVQAQGMIQRMRFEQRIGFTLCIATVTRPAIFSGMFNHVRAHGIQFDVALAGQQVTVFLGETGTKAPFP